jgi:hypothetical protein
MIRTPPCGRSAVRGGAAGAVLLAVLTACRTPPPPVAPPARTQAENTQEPVDASYDWHVLLAAPFGSVLKDIPAALHEVLLLHDRELVPTDEAECYAADAPPPRFVGRSPEEYLLCFRHDRLSRIQATVPLGEAEAPGVFAAACRVWLKNAPGDAAPADATSCDGTDGDVHVSGRLEQGPAAALSIILDGEPAP